MENRIFIFVLSAFLSTFVAAFTISLGSKSAINLFDSLFYFFKEIPSWSIALVVVTFLGMIGALFPVLIRTTSRFYEIEPKISLSKASDRFSERLDELEKATAAQINGTDLEEFVQEKVENLSSKIVYGALQEKIIEKAGLDPISGLFDEIISELRHERELVASKANFNLSFGLLFAIGSIAILYWALLGVTPSTGDNTNESIIVLVSLKTSLSLVAAVFSFFFLQLYRNSVQDRKFYQNEITNIATKKAALVLSNYKNNGEVDNVIIDNLLSTERNFILKKGETTTHLKQVSQDANFLSGLTEKLKQ